MDIEKTPDCEGPETRRTEVLRLDTSDLELLKHAGVIRDLEKLPKYANQVEDLKEARAGMTLNLYTVPTMVVDPSCDGTNFPARLAGGFGVSIAEQNAQVRE